MSLLRQLLLTLLSLSICDLRRTSADDNATLSVDTMDEVCAQLTVRYEEHSLLLDREPFLMYNRSVWSRPDDGIYVSYDGWTSSWEILLPSASALPNVYRVVSTELMPPSAVWTNKWTQNQIAMQYLCSSSPS